MTLRLRQLTGCLIGLTVLSSMCAAAEKGVIGTAAGHRAIVSGVRFACGEWAIKSRQSCPAAARGYEPKLVIYATELTPGVMKLAQAYEKQITDDEELKWSFVEVLDEKGARTNIRSDEYYTRHDVEKRLKEIRSLADEHKIKRLTFGLSAAPGNKERERIGIPEDADALVVYIHGQPRQSRMVRFVEAVDSSKLDDEKIGSLIQKMDKVRLR